MKTEKIEYANRGKSAESPVEKWLDAASSASISLMWHRFPDTRAARNVIAKQPSDYLVCHKRPGHEGITTFLEVKETAEQYRLPKDKLSQFGKLKLFWLAGARPIVLISRTHYGDWTYLRDREILFYETVPKSFPWEGRPSFPTAAVALQEIFR